MTSTVIEARELCHERLGILKLLYGKQSAPRRNVAVPAGVLCGKRGDIIKKKVRVTIDPNPEKITDLTLKLGGTV